MENPFFRQLWKALREKNEQFEALGRENGHVDIILALSNNLF